MLFFNPCVSLAHFSWLSEPKWLNSPTPPPLNLQARFQWNAPNDLVIRLKIKVLFHAFTQETALVRFAVCQGTLVGNVATVILNRCTHPCYDFQRVVHPL